MNENMRIHVKNILAGIGTMAILAVALMIAIPNFANYDLGSTGSDSSLYTDTGVAVDSDVASSPDLISCGFIEKFGDFKGYQSYFFDGNFSYVTVSIKDDTFPDKSVVPDQLIFQVSLAPKTFIYKYDSAGKLLKTITPLDSYGNPFIFINPLFTIFDKKGNFYVYDTNLGELHKFDGTTNKLVINWPINYVYSLAIDSNDFIYAGVSGNIVKYDTNGKKQTLNLGFKPTQPEGIAFDGSNNLYVTDAYNHVVNKYTSSGTVIFKNIGGKGSADGQFDHPQSIAVSANSFFVADLNNDRIQEFTLDGKFIASLAGNWGLNGGISRPGSMFVDQNGNLNVAMTGTTSPGQLPRIETYGTKCAYLIVDLSGVESSNLFDFTISQNKGSFYDVFSLYEKNKSPYKLTSAVDLGSYNITENIRGTDVASVSYTCNSSKVGQSQKGTGNSLSIALSSYNEVMTCSFKNFY